MKDRRRFNDPRYKKRARPKADSLYTMDEVARVQRMLSRPTGRATCPVCGGSFTLGPIDRRGAESVRQVWCAGCGRGAVVTNCALARVMVLVKLDPLKPLLRSMLSVPGHEVLEPPNTRAALDVYAENPTDIVIIDSAMVTQSDGQEFIRRLRLEFPDARTIVLAPRPSYRAADPSAAAAQLVATRVVRMPFTRDDLLQALKEARP